METLAAKNAEVEAPGFWNHPTWNFLLMGLLIWQGWMTLTLFGTEQPWTKMVNDEPIVSGRHPLHLYHGYLGAHAFFDHGSLCCYDPNFQAGYPKTPVFDGGSRPSELFLIMSGGKFRPAAYKIGLAIFCLLVPLLIALGAGSAGLSRGAVCLSVLFGLLVFWGKPCRQAVEAGEIDLLLSAVASLAQVGLLIQFDRCPCFYTWFGVLLTGYLAWFAHPLFAALLLPLALIYLLSVGQRHNLLWHLALLISLAGAVAINYFWLIDWVNYWWVRRPNNSVPLLLSHRTFQTVWNASLWGSPADRTLGTGLVAMAFFGVWILNETQKRPAARLLGFGSLGCWLLALGGICWEPLSVIGTARLSIPAHLFAVLPAMYAFQKFTHWLHLVCNSRSRAFFVGMGILLVVGYFLSEQIAVFVYRGFGAAPLTIGLNEDRKAIVSVLDEVTTPEARILWEDRSDQKDQRWTVLLPRLTKRAYIGGLDSEAEIEHCYAGFVDQTLAGRPLQNWSYEDLERFCRKYNIGWIVCWTPSSANKIRSWPGVREAAVLTDNGQGVLFDLKHLPRSFALQGQAELIHADAQRITLGKVEPVNGKVVLSLHYQKGMKVSPSVVKIEREIDAEDPINFVRLKLPGPVSRVTVTWEER